MVHLEVGVCARFGQRGGFGRGFVEEGRGFARTYAVHRFLVLSDTLASVADELSLVSTLGSYGYSAIALQRQSASRPSIASPPRSSSSGLSGHTGPSAPCPCHRTS